MKRALLTFAFTFLTFANVAVAADPLPSWNDTATKKAILDFVAQVTTEGFPNFVPPAERIAVFDNDGTLWCEQPMYVQLAFALDRVKALAAEASGMEGQAAVQGRAGRRPEDAGRSPASKGIVELVAATHAGMTSDEFDQDRRRLARDGAASALQAALHRNASISRCSNCWPTCAPTASRPIIVSGGGVEFMRPWTEKVYGIPPEQVVGSSDQDEVRDAGRQAGAHAAARRSTSSTTRPASRSASTKYHRPAADRRLRQLRRRLRDAAMDDGRRKRAAVRR